MVFVLWFFKLQFFSDFFNTPKHDNGGSGSEYKLVTKHKNVRQAVLQYNIAIVIVSRFMVVVGTLPLVLHLRCGRPIFNVEVPVHI